MKVLNANDENAIKKNVKLENKKTIKYMAALLSVIYKS